MRAVGNHRGARTISLALVAGLVAFEAVLVLFAGAVGIPGLYLVRFADGRDGAPQAQIAKANDDGGESVVAKLPEVESMPKPAPSAAKAEDAPVPAGEPRLDGLADEQSWDREHAEPSEHKSFAADSAGREVLPWAATEPVPLEGPVDATASLAKPAEPAAPEAPHPALPPAQLPASADVEGWVKAKATEIKGEDRGRPLFHFELWLEPPEEMKQLLAAVTYDFNTPAVMPQSQISSEQKTGFRISAGGLTCADKITVTLKFKDGRSQQVAVDGCRLLG
jgi:hypothetical protein